MSVCQVWRPDHSATQPPPPPITLHVCGDYVILKKFFDLHFQVGLCTTCAILLHEIPHEVCTILFLSHKLYASFFKFISQKFFLKLHMYVMRVGDTGGLMVSALDSEVNGLGSSPERGQFVLSVGKKLKSHTWFWSLQSRFEPWLETFCCVLGQESLISWCLSSQRGLNGVTLRWTSIPSRGRRNTSICFVLLKPG